MSFSYMPRQAEEEFAKDGSSAIVTYMKDCIAVNNTTDLTHCRQQFAKKFGPWGSKYSTPSVEERKLSKVQSDACALILGDQGSDGFWSSTDDTTCFEHFTRSPLSVQLVARVLDYTVMNQGKSSLCGPISVVMDVARRRPDRYVQYVIDLATRRDARLGVADNEGIHVHIRKKSSILKAKATEDGMPMADYVAVAGLRNSECFLPYRSKLTSTMLEGATIDSTIAKWLREAGYQDVEVFAWSWGNSVVAGNVSLDGIKLHLSQLLSKLQSGWTVVCSMTGANLTYMTLQRTARDDFLERVFCGHYVLMRGVTLSSNGATFDLVTWGEQTDDVTKPARELTWSEILGSYRGYVCGKCE
jgi:hypothetical protein